MANKTDTEVIIGGKVYTLSSNDSEEYMQRVASYINSKISEFSKIDGFKRQSVDTQNVLLELNIADDYFKARKELEEFKAEAEDKERDLYDVKHDLITAQMKVKGLEENLSDLQDENTELQELWQRIQIAYRKNCIKELPWNISPSPNIAVFSKAMAGLNSLYDCPHCTNGDLI